MGWGEERGRERGKAGLPAATKGSMSFSKCSNVILRGQNVIFEGGKGGEWEGEGRGKKREGEG